jgi:hypothetical protein
VRLTITVDIDQQQEFQTIMADLQAVKTTVAEVKATIATEKAEVAAKFKQLRDEIAAGKVATPADLDALIVDLKGIGSSVGVISDEEPEPGPSPEPTV